MLVGYNTAKSPDEAPLIMPNLYFLNFGGSLSEMYDVFKFQSQNMVFKGISNLLQSKSKFFRGSKHRPSEAIWKTKEQLKYEGHCNAFVKILKDDEGTEYMRLY